MDTTEVVRFQYSVRHFILEHGSYNDVQSAEFTKYVSTLISEFWKAHTRISPPTCDAALEAFEIWFLENKDKDAVKTMATVKVEITRHYGAVSVCIGLTNDVEITKGYDFFAERMKLQQLVEHELQVYEAENLHKLKQPNPGNLAPSDKVTEDMACDRLSIQVANGKQNVRAHGGRFSKFGVPVYPEVLELAGISVDSIGLSGLDTPDTTMTVELVDGKPKRVTNINLSF